ncbi:hypothetical protein [Tropicimonas sp. S265A]|uniref:hypothetical protein n=1 Tax=Tropicimonas sp. S265A TaxID=3415134 RepID=UPI003C7D3CD7
MTNTLPTVYLHIGHSKTGTSAIQNLFTLNRDTLQTMGICYPDHRDVREAEAGKISSGNILWRSGDVTALAEEILDNLKRNPGYARYVFSSEYMFLPFLDVLPLLLNARHEYRLAILLAVREPMEMLASYYSQVVKRHGFFGEIEEIVDHQTFLLHASNVLQACTSEAVAVHVFNYSMLRSKITECIFEAIGVDWSELSEFGGNENRIVNRSLTHEETKLIKALNKGLGADIGSLCSDALVERHPDIPAEAEPIPPKIAAAFAARNMDAANLINAFLPAGHELRPDRAATGHDATFAPLSSCQLETVCEVLKPFVTRVDVEKLLEDRRRLQEDLQQAREEINLLSGDLKHARKYPWKYVRQAAAMRLRTPD